MASIPQAPTRIIVGEGDLKPPLWVEDLLAGAPPEALPVAIESGQAWTRNGDGFGLTSVQFTAEGMDILTFQQAVADAYRTVLEQLRSDHAVRFWAFVPRIHAEYGHGLDRYMAFNAGRFAAFSAWLGGREAFSRSMPTASAVGSPTPDFALYCLASRWPGQPVENPRQIPAYEYSKRFGPLPPCFARATLLRRKPFHEDLLLVGGTASIVGEDSQHPGVVVLQARETFRNLASLVCSAAQGAAGPLPETDSEVAVSLARFKEVRAYYRETRHSQQVRDLVQAAFSAAARIETSPAELCRPELLVEIEGVARLPAKS